MTNDDANENGMLDQLADDMIEDPDAPEHGHAAPPPQTVKNEPSSGNEPPPRP